MHPTRSKTTVFDSIQIEGGAMPIEFLTDEQKRHYGRFDGDPSPDQLSRYFYIDDHDCDLINKKRGAHNRLGYAIQLGTVRFLGTFLSDPTAVPDAVIAMMASQLDIEDYACLELYRIKESRLDHTAEIRQRYGYRNFTDQPEHFQLVRWLYARAWLDSDRPSVLFDLTTSRLLASKILLPAASTLTRLITRVRTRSTERFYRLIISTIPPELQKNLSQMLDVEAETRQTPFDRLRTPPTYLSGPGLVRATQRIEETRALRMTALPKPKVPLNRIATLSRYTATVKAQTVLRMPVERKIATLYAFACMVEAAAHDDALDILSFLLNDLFNKAEQANKKQRLRTLKDLDRAAITVKAACDLMVEQACPYQDVRAKVMLNVGPRKLMAAMATIDELTRPPDDRYYPELQAKYRSVRRYLPHVLTSIQFKGTQAATPIVEALDFLKSLEIENKRSMSGAPAEFINYPWKRYVFDEDGTIDRQAYTFCFLDQLRSALSRREVFVPAGIRYADPRVGMLDGVEWEMARSQVCRVLGRLTDPHQELEALTRRLDETYRQVAANLHNNSDVRIETVNGKEELVIAPLDELDEPASCKVLRNAVKSLLPRVDLPEILLEIHYLTGFANEFSHINESESRAEDIHISICACLLAEACNIGLEPLIRPDVPALTRARLSWVQQNYIRSETLTRSNARLVKFQSDIPLAQEWGGGHVASVDGLRFVVPVRTINASANPKYFGRERGITYYNMTSDQCTGLNGIIEAGTVRDSLILLAVVLGQQTHLQPTEIMTDTGAYTDIMFGIFWLLGYQFCPRLADMGDARFWRIDKEAHYGPLNNLARHKVNSGKIINNWDDFLRLAGSLKLGLVHPYNLIRTLQKGDKTTELQKGLENLGRINKTIYMLNVMDDPVFRRRVLAQLNIHEGRHKLSRTTFHGRRGQLRKRYREGQEDQLGALGLVTNVLVLWNTLYMNAALDHLRSQGMDVRPEDARRLKPFARRHINFMGRYSFTTSESIQHGSLRSLHFPESPLDRDLY
jgi:TnpA family transposase